MDYCLALGLEHVSWTCGLESVQRRCWALGQPSQAHVSSRTITRWRPGFRVETGNGARSLGSLGLGAGAQSRGASRATWGHVALCKRGRRCPCAAVPLPSAGVCGVCCGDRLVWEARQGWGQSSHGAFSGRANWFSLGRPWSPSEQHLQFTCGHSGACESDVLFSPLPRAAVCS